MVVDRRRVQDTGDAVLQQHEGDGHQEDDPVLVKGDNRDRHEEVKVHLDVAAGEMDEDRGRRQEQDFADRDVRWFYEEIDPDVFGEELETAAYSTVDRIAAVVLTARKPGVLPC